MSARRRGPILWVGGVLVAAGLVLVAYVGWELIGTNIVSHHRQQQTIEQLRDDWAASTTTASDDIDEPEVGAATALVRVPRFGGDYEMPVLEGVGDDELASGFGHFEDSADPGQAGNYALAAHRITHGQPLRDMPDLRPGDEVLVETRTAVYRYELDTDPDALVVDRHASWVVQPHPVNPESDGVQPGPETALLTLTTCAELFHDDDRMVAFGHLVDVRQK